jgi:hypothetical protein
LRNVQWTKKKTKKNKKRNNKSRKNSCRFFFSVRFHFSFFVFCWESSGGWGESIPRVTRTLLGSHRHRMPLSFSITMHLFPFLFLFRDWCLMIVKGTTTQSTPKKRAGKVQYLNCWKERDCAKKARNVANSCTHTTTPNIKKINS